MANVATLCEWSEAVAWVGSRPLTPDCHPLTGSTHVGGLYLNVGHSFNGWREAVLSARVLGEQMGGGGGSVPAIAAKAYSVRRYQPWYDG